MVVDGLLLEQVWKVEKPLGFVTRDCLASSLLLRTMLLCQQRDELKDFQADFYFFINGLVKVKH